MENRRAQTFNAPGASSLMVIFAVLCLTVFAILSLSTVLANGRLAEASHTSVSEYYAADCRAEETLALLRQGKLPQGVTVSGNDYSYQVPVSDTQAIFVSVELKDGTYLVASWQLRYTAEWKSDESLNLWNGE